MPPMQRSMTMGSMVSPQTYMPSGMGMNGMMTPQMPMMPQMQQMPAPNPQQDSMQQFMQMQMQLMQNMLSMQQSQMGQTPPPQPQQQPQPQDYLGVPMPANRRGSMAPSIRSQAPTQGRAMTMLNPPTQWNDVPHPGQRPNSAMPQTYAPSGLNTNGGGPGAGYTPSIAPSERSNIGMPSRYRPVTVGNDGSGRTNSMTSNLTLQTFGNQNFANQNRAPQVPPHTSRQPSKSTVRVIEKPKGAPRTAARPVVDEDEEEGWAEMAKKREAKKKFSFGKKNKERDTMVDLYHNMD